MPIEAIAQRIQQAGVLRASVEAGHVYADQTASFVGPNDRLFGLLGATLGGRIGSHLRRTAGVVDVQNHLFIDEMHVKNDSAVAAFSHHDITQNYADNGFPVDAVVLETDHNLHATAYALLDRIRVVSPEAFVKVRQGYSIDRNRLVDLLQEREGIDRDIKDPRRLGQNIGLAGRTSKSEGKVPTKPTCSLLDAAFTLHKAGGMLGESPDGFMTRVAEEGSVASSVACLTVLPDIYRQQQENTHLILAAAGLSRVQLMSIFFKPEEAKVKVPAGQVPAVFFQANF